MFTNMNYSKLGTLSFIIELHFSNPVYLLIALSEKIENAKKPKEQDI